MHTSLPAGQYDCLIVGTSPAGLEAAFRLSGHRLERSIDLEAWNKPEKANEWRTELPKTEAVGE